MKRLVATWILVVTASPGLAQPPSRAAWWLAQDEVKPIADLVNRADPGKGVKFIDRIGKFQVTAEDRVLTISGDFPEANIWRFDLTTFERQFDMRKLYIEKSANVAFPDPKSLGTR